MAMDQASALPGYYNQISQVRCEGLDFKLRGIWHTLWLSDDFNRLPSSVNESVKLEQDDNLILRLIGLAAQMFISHDISWELVVGGEFHALH